MNTSEQKRRHIVIVDDEPVNLELAENVLQDNYKLTKLISGEQLLKFLGRSKPDMILLDIQMPKMNGYEVMEELKKNEHVSKIPVIFLTGEKSAESERKCFSAGARDFISKPFDDEVMLARIRSQMALYVYQSDLERMIAEKTAKLDEIQRVMTLNLATMVESRDGMTGSHIRNTTAYLEVLLDAILSSEGYEDAIAREQLSDLLRASSLHDIGKISVNEQILQKPGPLDKEEFDDIKKHSDAGARIIEGIVGDSYGGAFLTYAQDMAKYHHERWDGTGYPHGLSGEEIPLYVRALSIVDVYEALVSERPYKRAFEHEAAIAIMTNESGKFFDPALFNIFMQSVETIRSVRKDSV